MAIGIHIAGMLTVRRNARPLSDAAEIAGAIDFANVAGNCTKKRKRRGEVRQPSHTRGTGSPGAVLADDEHHSRKTSTDRIEDRVVDERLAGGPNRIQLFQAALAAA